MNAPPPDLLKEAAAWLADHPGIDGGPAHARLSPSAADSWMVCPDYPNAVEGLPNESSEFAAEGTAAHAISDTALDLQMDAYDFIGHRTKIEQWTFEWTLDDADYLQPGIDEIRSFDGQFFGEHKVDLSKWLGPQQFGTLDRGVVGKDLIVVGDLKWGRGVPVQAVGNRQIRLYALGFWWNVARHITKATEFLFIIDQPRHSSGGGRWRQSLDQLLAFGDEALRAADATRLPNPPRVASEKGCMWCARRDAPGGCQTHQEFMLDLIGMKFEDLDSPEPPAIVKSPLTPERRTYLLDHKSMLEKWLEALHVQAIDDAMAGRPVPGKKLVEGRRPARKWKDNDKIEPAVEAVLGADAWARKLKSPTQVEKEIGKEEFADRFGPLVNYGDPKPVLVSEHDDRPAITPMADKFDEMEIGNG